MSKKRRYRPQTPKSRNQDLHKAMVELRQGSRTSPVPSGKTYRRPKAGSRNREW